MEPLIRVSLVIPARNEASLLPRLLDTVDTARARYQAGPGAVEVIVADNGSTDRTAEIARNRGCRVVDVAPRIIAAVRNGGAAVAVGSFLAFVDADMQLDPDTFNAIDTALRDPGVVGGASGIRPERWSAGIAVAYAIGALNARLTGIDAGVTYCRRADFERIGGYDARRASLEDVDFLWRLKRLGAKRGQRLVRLRTVRSVFSTRKFDRFGDWHWLALAARLVSSLGWRVHARSAVVREYWYDERD
jgi:glycosyltransferase involved in cell wall biosynthesis